MEEELKTLRKHLGGLVKTMLYMKSKIQALEKKVEENQEEEIRNILRKQYDIDKAIAANVEAITKIDKEIINFSQKKQNDATKKQTSEVGVVRNAKKCRYFNRGYCKYKHKCKYLFGEWNLWKC